MNRNKLIGGLTLTLVLVTIAVSFGTMSSYSQKEVPSQKNENPFEDLSKYPTVEYDAPEPTNAVEREERRIKNKRYDVNLPIIKNPHPEDTALIGSDVEPLPSAIPFAKSRVVIIGEILNSKAFLSNEKKGIYSEYSVRIENILKEDKKKKLKIDEIIMIDRAGGVVQYPNRQKMLYLNDWQNLPKINTRYILFLEKDNDQNPNYKILTGYQINDNKITALDNHPDFEKFNGKSEEDLINQILKNKQLEVLEVKDNEENF